ncbi:unnamed protein product [Euphydryas editha]|uniref:Uncharacterized protein n=1 Tax=Euphydryas editha TaxID=104508 RepID=A0AAU9UBW5_EUPED|nr:unnamed protein product [Euphydryas editha]
MHLRMLPHKVTGMKYSLTWQNVPEYPLKPSGAFIVVVGHHGIAFACNRDAPTVGLPMRDAFAYRALVGIVSTILPWWRVGG